MSNEQKSTKNFFYASTFQIRQNYLGPVGFLPEPDFCRIWKSTGFRPQLEPKSGTALVCLRTVQMVWCFVTVLKCYKTFGWPRLRPWLTLYIGCVIGADHENLHDNIPTLLVTAVCCRDFSYTFVYKIYADICYDSLENGCQSRINSGMGWSKIVISLTILSRPSVFLSIQKSFSDFNTICYVGRSRRVLHDGMP